MRLAIARLIIGASTAGALITGLNAGSAKAVLSCTFGNTAGCNGTDNGVTFSGFTYLPPSGQNSIEPDPNDSITITYDSGSNSHIIFYNFAAASSSLAANNGDYAGGGAAFSAAASGKTFKSATLNLTATSLNVQSGAGVDYGPNSVQSGAFFSQFSNGILADDPFSSPNPANLYAEFSALLNLTGAPVGSPFPAASIANVTQTLYYENTGAAVPGPLPVLGAGVAFGFSRRLRRRIQKQA